MDTKSFKPLTLEEESKLLKEGPGFKRLKEYISPLVDDFIAESALPDIDKEWMKEWILDRVPRSATRFIEMKRTWKFSTFFSWHILEMIEREVRLSKIL